MVNFCEGRRLEAPINFGLRANRRAQCELGLFVEFQPCCLKKLRFSRNVAKCSRAGDFMSCDGGARVEATRRNQFCRLSFALQGGHAGENCTRGADATVITHQTERCQGEDVAFEVVDNWQFGADVDVDQVRCVRAGD